MSEINKNITIQEQYYSTAKGPLDAKLTPADTYAELTDAQRIPAAQRYVGLTVTVLNNGNPIEYWLVGGTAKSNWKIKTGNIVPTKSDLLLISPSACTVGLEMIVQVDETNENKLTKYWVKEINNGVVTWEKKEGVSEDVFNEKISEIESAVTENASAISDLTDEVELVQSALTMEIQAREELSENVDEISDTVGDTEFSGGTVTNAIAELQALLVVRGDDVK